MLLPLKGKYHRVSFYFCTAGRAPYVQVEKKRENTK